MWWALAFVVILGVGLPVAAWWHSRRHPPPPVTRLGTGYDRIDKWLLRHYQLAPLDRDRVRTAVFHAVRWTTRHWHAPRISLPPRCCAESSEACAWPA